MQRPNIGSLFSKRARAAVTEESIIRSLENNVVTIFCRNHYDGVGDAKHAIDIYRACKDKYKESNTKLKLILILDDNFLNLVSLFLTEEEKKLLAICVAGDKSDAEPSQNPEIFLIIYNNNDIEDALDSILASIHNDPAMNTHWRNTNLFINVSCHLLNEEMFTDLPKDCFRYSINEYGPSEPMMGINLLQRIPFIETNLGADWYEAGMKFDEDIWLYYKFENHHRRNLLLRLKAKYIAHTLIDHFRETGGLAVGYVQTHKGAYDFIIAAAKAINTPVINIVLPLSKISDETLNTVKTDFSQIVMINESETIICAATGGEEKPTLRLLEYKGLDEEDLKILCSNANVIAATGDNSFGMALSVPTCVPIIIFPKWKDEFLKKLIEYLYRERTLYPHLKNYFLMTHDEDKNFHHEDRAFLYASFFSTVNYVDCFAKELRTEWQMLTTHWHEHKNFTHFLNDLLNAAAYQHYCKEKKAKGLSCYDAHEVFISAAGTTRNSSFIVALLYSCILNDDITTLTAICAKVSFLPPIGNQTSLTMVALLLGKNHLAAILVKKDIDLLTKIFELLRWPNDLKMSAYKFFNDQKINISGLWTFLSRMLHDVSNEEEIKALITHNLDFLLGHNNKYLLFQPTEITDGKVVFTTASSIFWEYMPNVFVLLNSNGVHNSILISYHDKKFALNFSEPGWIQENLSREEINELNANIEMLRNKHVLASHPRKTL